MSAICSGKAFFEMYIIIILLGFVVGYLIGRYCVTSKWHKKYLVEMNDENGFVDDIERIYQNSIYFYSVIYIIVVTVVAPIFILVLPKDNELYAFLLNFVIFNALFFTPLIPSALISAKYRAKKDKEKYFPTGELIAESFSPLKSYKITAWKVWGNYVRCEILKISYNTTRTIYFNACDDVSIEWLDNDTIVINGEELNAETGVYDARIHPLRSGLQ